VDVTVPGFPGVGLVESKQLLSGNEWFLALCQGQNGPIPLRCCRGKYPTGDPSMNACQFDVFRVESEELHNLISVFRGGTLLILLPFLDGGSGNL
jgi:hypothetical protein